MTVNWTIFLQIATPIAVAVITFFVGRYFREREKLIAFYSHIASHSLNPVIEGKEVTHIRTHAVVIRNNGNKTATNVRIIHNVLPDFTIYPDTDYDVKELPSGGKELVIPRITPKKEYTISYLYFPPIIFDQVNSSIESDAGSAKMIDVRLQQIVPQWILFLFISFMILGLIAFIYIVYEVVRQIFF